MNTIDEKAFEEALYKEAFNKAIEDMESAKPGTSYPTQPSVEDSSEEKDTNTIDIHVDSNASEWDEKDAAQRQASIDESNAEQPAPRRRGRPRKEETQTDTEFEYEKLYNEYKQTAESQINLYRSRLNQLSKEFQELKASTKTKKEEPVQLPDNVKEVFDMYPDIGNAVASYVESQKASMLRDFEEQIQPIKSHLVLNDVQKHENAIKEAHPDLQSILQSGDLNLWIDSLPPVMKAGAQHVYQYGSTDEVISLLNEYKESRGISSAKRGAGKQSVREVHGTSAYAKAQGNSESHRMDSRNYAGGTDQGYGDRRGVMEDDDPLVQRVMAALAVKSGNSPMSVTSTPTRREKTAEDIFKEVTADFESTRARYRR